MTPTERINEQLAAFRAVANLKGDVEAKFAVLEMWARQHAHEMGTREEYVAHIEKIANDRAAELATTKKKLDEYERGPKEKAERIARLKKQQAEIAAELAKAESA